MELAVFLSRLVLVATFLVAGASKLADRDGSRRSFLDFGVPISLAGPLTIGLPLVELAVAAALVVPDTSRVGGWAAFAALMVFIVAIALNLVRGRRPDCHCFGRVNSGPIGGRTVARNALLALLSLLVAMEGPGSFSAVRLWIGDLAAAERAVVLALGALLGLLLLEGWFMWNLLRQQGRILLRLDAIESRFSPQPRGLPIGDAAPEFRLTSLEGEEVTLEVLCEGERSTVLIFWEPNCGPCLSMVPEISAWQKEDHRVSVAMISGGRPEDNRAALRDHDVRWLLIQEGLEVYTAYQAPGTPSAVLVTADRTIGSHVVAGPEDVSALVREALTRAQ